MYAALVLLLTAGLRPDAAQAGISTTAPRQISEHYINVLATHRNSVFYHDPQTKELILYDLNTWAGQTVGQASAVGGVAFTGSHAAFVSIPEKEAAAHLVLVDLSTIHRTDVVSAGYFAGPIVTKNELVWGQTSTWGADFVLYAQDLSTGARKELGKASLWGRDDRYPLLSDGRYLVWQGSGTIHAIDLETGNRQSRYVDRLRRVYATDRGRVVFGYQASTGCSSSEREAIALWDIAANTAQDIDSRTCGRGYSAPALRGDVAAVAQTDDPYQIILIELSTGRRVRVAADGVEKGNLYLTDSALVHVARRGGGASLVAITMAALPDRVHLPRPVTDSPPLVFNDLSKSHWAYSSLRLAAIGGYMRGYPDGTLRPDAQVTRAEFLTILMRAYPKSRASGAPFVDVPASHWAYAAISQARGLGLVTGNENRFHPDSPISRAEMAVMLQRFLALPQAEGSGTEFADTASGWGWAAPSVDVLARHGLLTGFPDGTFGPSRSATRAQVAAIFNRLYT